MHEALDGLLGWEVPWRSDGLLIPALLDFTGGSDGTESTCNVRDLGSIPALGRSPGGGHGNPLQYSCLESPMDRGARERLAESDTTELHVYRNFSKDTQVSTYKYIKQR